MKKGLIIIFLIVCFVSCKEKYLPPEIDLNLNYLVMDGTLINGSDSTIIRLSRTKKLDENPVLEGEQNAQVSVEDADGNTVYNFVQLNNRGEYAVPGMFLDINKKYRLRINTANGSLYVSEDIVVKDTPPIDSISWRRKDEGVTIYVNTHDPANNTKYYRWDYIETWDYYSNYFTTVKYDKDATTISDMFPTRTGNEFVYHCWTNNRPTEILPGSSTQLSEDRISYYPLRFIPLNSIELNSTYSILVKQYALTKEAYEYFLNIKKISEQTGSLFDAQPSQLPSNIHCINNPAEQVIGFLSASSVQQERIFIRTLDVQPWRYSKYCDPLYPVPTIPDSIIYYFGGRPPLLMPVSLIENPFLTAIEGAVPDCVDCTTRGGTTVKPDFWP